MHVVVNKTEVWHKFGQNWNTYDEIVRMTRVSLVKWNEEMCRAQRNAANTEQSVSLLVIIITASTAAVPVK